MANDYATAMDDIQSVFKIIESDAQNDKDISTMDALQNKYQNVGF